MRKLADILVEKGWRIATAESCTGGLLGSRITDVPGASRYYLGGVIAYDNRVKEKILGVRRETLEKYGAVSEKCAGEMAEGVARLMGANVAIATTGIAGPSGGTEEKPIGTVFIAYYILGKTHVERKRFHGSRVEIKEKIVERAISQLWGLLRDIS